MKEEITPGTITIAIKNAQKGDSGEFSKLVDLHQKDVERLARYFLGGEKRSNLMLGEDIMQSVFLQLWEGLSTGKTWFVKAVTDREELFSVLERLTWLRAKKAIRHSNQEKRRGTVRDADADTLSENSLSSAFQDNSSSRPDLVFEVKTLIEEAKTRLGKSDHKLVLVFEDLLRDTTVDESAQNHGFSKRSVQRKRDRIKNILKDWMDLECQAFGADG